MNTRTRILAIVSFCLTIAIDTVADCCCCNNTKPALVITSGPPIIVITGGPPVILRQPLSRIAERGTHVDFTVIATNVGPMLTYQWHMNGTNAIPGATNRTYCIEETQMTDVAGYRVVVTGNGSVSSDVANLSVYFTRCTNSVTGTLAAPLTAFKPGAIMCDGTTFDQVSSNYFHFYGPNASPQVGPFQNTTGMTKLTLDTFSVDNNDVDTGIRIQKNWSPYSTLSCSNNAPDAPISQPLLSKIGSVTLSLNSGTTQNRYRVTVFYKSATIGSNTNITFNWLYHL